jgi:hypothetical protein
LYYKGLFDLPNDRSITMDESCRDDIPHVMDDENRILVEEFTEEEVKKKLCSKWSIIKSPGPDGFPAEFYQVF